MVLHNWQSEISQGNPFSSLFYISIDQVVGYALGSKKEIYPRDGRCQRIDHHHQHHHRHHHHQHHHRHHHHRMPLTIRKRSNLQAYGIFLDLFDKVMLVYGLSGSTTTLLVMARCSYYNYNYGKVWLHWRNRQNQPKASFYNKHNRVTWKFIASTRHFWKLLTQAIQGAILLIPLIFVTCRPAFFSVQKG